MPDLSEERGRIILVRHGETEANRMGCFAESNDIPLTETGMVQATELARLIQEEHAPRGIFCSEFLRARQTAGIIARQLGLEVEVAGGLHERDFGWLKGKAYARMGDMMRGDIGYDPELRWLWAPEGGESLESVRVRVVAGLKKLQAFCGDDEEIVVVSHGAVMEAVSAHLANSWENASVPGNCALMVVEFSQL